MYDANIFASVYDVIPPEARGSAAGLMNTIGWLGGGALAPVAIGVLAQKYGLSVAIAMAAAVYLLAGGFLLTGIFWFVKRDAAAFSGGLACVPPGAGMSELSMSSTAFQLPSACFLKMVTYLPRSIAGAFVFGSVMVIEYVPCEYASLRSSPHRLSSPPNWRAKFGSASIGFKAARMLSFPEIAGAFGQRTAPSSA